MPEGHFVPGGDAWRGALLALDDAIITVGGLDAVVPMNVRVVEPRLLSQTDVFWVHDSRRVDLAGCDATALAGLLGWLIANAPDLHHVAALDEQATTSTAVAWAMRQADVPLIAEVDPVAWVESTPLARWLAARCP